MDRQMYVMLDPSTDQVLEQSKDRLDVPSTPGSMDPEQPDGV